MHPCILVYIYLFTCVHGAGLHVCTCTLCSSGHTTVMKDTYIRMKWSCMCIKLQHEGSIASIML